MLSFRNESPVLHSMSDEFLIGVYEVMVARDARTIARLEQKVTLLEIDVAVLTVKNDNLRTRGFWSLRRLLPSSS